jgi:hypothetical protein
MPWLTENSLILIILALGATLVVAGETLYWYVNSTISSLNMKLLQADLSTSNRDAFQGSLNWWQTQKTSTYEPISLFIIIAGIVTVLVLAAYCALKIFQNRQNIRGTNYQTQNGLDASERNSIQVKRKGKQK